MSTIRFNNRFRTVYLFLKRHYIFTLLVLLFFVALTSGLKNMRSHITKMDAPVKTGNDIHMPSSDFFSKKIPDALENQQEEGYKEGFDPYDHPGKRMADVARAPVNFGHLAKPPPGPVPRLNDPVQRMAEAAGKPDEVPRLPPHPIPQLNAPVERMAKAAGKPDHLPRLPPHPIPQANMFPQKRSAASKSNNPLDEVVKNEADAKAEPTFAAQMIINAKKRKYSRRYEFKDVPDTVYKSLHDITHLCPEGDPPIKFSKWFNTFCWFENECGCHEKPSMIRCFPKFHLIGFPKAGTSDLFRRLMKHPQVTYSKKETNYWSVTRFIELGNETELLRGNDTMALFTEDHIINLENASVITKGIEPYLDFYNEATTDIEREFGGANGKTQNPSKLVLGEGSVTYAYSSLGLRISIGNLLKKSPMEVDCTIAKVIRYITPEAKIIVLLRNPVERLYSDYRNLFNALPAKNKTAPDFHKRVVNRIEMWKKCVLQKSEENCINSPQFEAVAVHSAIIGLVRSIYVVHLQKWLKEFPRKQIYFVHFEERVNNPDKTLKEIVEFLDLEPLSPQKLREIAHEHIPMYEGGKPRPHQAGYGSEPMWESTRTILEEFYRPYNKRLAWLLGDEKYLWYDSPNPFTVPKRDYSTHD